MNQLLQSVLLFLPFWWLSVGFCCMSVPNRYKFPVIINTWISENATSAAWKVLEKSGNALDSVEAGCISAEMDQTQESISWGYHPDEQGNVTFDAMIINGDTREMGAVASMPDVKHAISVARAVMERTRHSMLVAEKATEFAAEMGFQREPLNNNRSEKIWNQWKTNKCQPNFRRNVSPDPTKSCGPYKPSKTVDMSDNVQNSRDGHDTIGMIAIDSKGSMAVGTTTNGAQFRVPGRVGDTAVIGSGGFVSSDIGGAVGTGDGDILMRYALTALAVEYMSMGNTPTEACVRAINRIPATVKFAGALAALDKLGNVGGSCRGFSHFEISVWAPGLSKMDVIKIPCS